MTSFIDSSNSLDEAAPDVRSRYETLFAPTEDSISISSDPVVDRIERHGWQYACGAQQLPRPAEFVSDKKCGAAFRERHNARRFVVGEHVKRVQVARVATEPLDNRLTDRTLKCSEAENGSFVVTQKELTKAVTEPADSIEENEVRTARVSRSLHL
jgi:hypothetical protein